VATLLGVEAPQVLPPPETAADLLAVAIAAAVLAPIGEEFFFRAFALTAWLRDLGARSALIRSTAFFAVVHLLTITTTDFVTGLLQAILVLTVIVPVGFVLGWLYLRRGLVAAITGHFAYNGILLALLQLGPLPN